MSQAAQPESGRPVPTGSIAVIGGGLAGLLAAWRLEQAGVSVTVLEGASRLGGAVKTLSQGGYLHEQAASSFLAKPGGMLALCQELGVPVVKAAANARRRWIYIDGKRRQVFFIVSGFLLLFFTGGKSNKSQSCKCK